MTERHYVIRRSGNGWVYALGDYRSSLFGTPGLAAEIARAAATRAHQRGDHTTVEVDLGAERCVLWRKAPANLAL